VVVNGFIWFTILYDRELINTISNLISVDGLKCFSQFIIVLSKEHCYEQFITRVTFSFAILRSIHIITEHLTMDKSAFESLEDCVVAVEGKVVYNEMKQCTNKSSIESCFKTLLTIETFDFHLGVLKLLATRNCFNVLKTIIQSIVEINIQFDLISCIVQTLPGEVSKPLLSVVKILQQRDSSYSHSDTHLPVPECNKLPINNGEACEFCEIVSKHCDKTPSSKHLAKFVIPYCAFQWKILGDLLGVPVHEIRNIHSDHPTDVKTCCREMLHGWLRRNVSASWESLLSALQLLDIQFHHSHPKSRISIPHYLPSSHLGMYEKYLRSSYTSCIASSSKDWPPNSHQHFVDLPLAKIPKEISKPKFDNQFLHYHEKKDYDIEKLTCYEQIFQCEQSSNCRVIVIEGNPGSGKTTLTYKICKDWAEGTILQHVSHLILLILRDKRINGAESLEKIIQIHLGQNNANHIYQDLVNSDGKNVIIWFDGWDELSDDKRHESLFTDLITCQLLTEAVIVVTTRPAAYGTIPQDSIMHKIEILQFTQTLSNEYIDLSFTDDDVKRQFIHEMNRVPSLHTLTYNPMCLSILIHVFKFSCKLPETITEVYKKFLLISLRHYNIKTFNDTKTLTSVNKLPQALKEILNGLEQLSFMSLSEDKLIFDDELVSEVVFHGEAVPIKFDGMGLLEVHDTEYDVGVIKNFNFLHKTIQELLAAMYLSKLESTHQEKEMKSLFGNIKFEMVWLFYVGLTKFELVSINNVFPDVEPESTESFQGELNNHQSVDTVLIQSCIHCNNLMESTVSQEFFIVLILCCYEAQHPTLCNKLLSYFFSSDSCYIYVPISASTQQTMIALSYFVSHSNKNCALQCLAPVFCGLKLLLTYLTKPDKVSGRLWRLLYIVPRGDLSDLLTLVQTQCYLQALALPYGSFSENDFFMLCECLKYNKSVLKLDLTQCNISKSGLLIVSDMLQVNTKIQCLALEGNNFSTLDLIEFLKSLLRTNTLQELRVSSNLYGPDVKDCVITINEHRRKLKVNNKFNIVLILEKYNRLVRVNL